MLSDDGREEKKLIKLDFYSNGVKVTAENQVACHEFPLEDSELTCCMDFDCNGRIVSIWLWTPFFTQDSENSLVKFSLHKFKPEMMKI